MQFQSSPDIKVVVTGFKGWKICYALVRQCKSIDDVILAMGERKENETRIFRTFRAHVCVSNKRAAGI